MNKYNFDDLVNRYNSSSSKYSEGKEVLPMWVADMDFHVLPEIKEAIIQRANIDAYGYTDSSEEYFISFINFFKRHHNIDIKRDEVFFSTGVVASIDSIFKHLFKPGDKVLMLTPIYHTFFNCIKNNGLELVELELDYQNLVYSLNIKRIEEVIKKEGIKVFLFCNPHNPVGLIYKTEELNEIARICKENNVLLISDEIHGELVDPGLTYYPMLGVNEAYLDNVITLTAPSKIFNLAGLHSSFIITTNNDLKIKLQDEVYHDDIGEPNFFSDAASVAAYTYGDEWLKELNEYLYNNKTYVYRYIKESLKELDIVDTPATYLMWIDVSKVTDNSEEFASRLKNEVGLWVSPGSQFRGNGRKFIRLNVATSKANVIDALARLTRFIRSK